MSDLSLPSARYYLPQIEERTSYGWRRTDPYAKLFEERIIFLGQAIDDTIANDVMAQLLTLESTDPDRDITIYINSPGGSFTSLMAIYDTMMFIRPDIQTVCMGQAASRPRAGRRASDWPCPTRGCSSTSPRPRAAARPATSRSRPARCCGCARCSRR